MKPARPSPSALRTFMDCERRLFYERIAKRPQPPSVPLSVGILYHSAIEKLIRHDEVDLGPLLETAKKAPSWTCDKPDAELIEEVRLNLERLSCDVLKWVLPYQSLEVWTTDVNPKAKYCAKIDMIGQTPVVDADGAVTGYKPEPCVIDWKSVNKPGKRRSQEATDTDMQLALYCIETGIPTAAFVEIPRDIQYPINVIVTKFSEYDLARWARYFEAQFTAMQSRGIDERNFRLSAPTSALCSPKWCPFWTGCPGGEGRPVG